MIIKEDSTDKVTEMGMEALSRYKSIFAKAYKASTNRP